jgi:hypothetical protein
MSRSTRLAIILVALAILIPALLIRLIGLDSNPPGLWQDEASSGYDAYLLWTTGRDRAGKFLPLIAASFGDYPLAGYRYLTAPFVGLFGLTPATERIVACLTGTSMVLATGFFAYQTFGKYAAVGAMLSGAFTPMWIQFSRYGSEAILLPFCLIFGAGLIELGRNPKYRRALYAGALVLAFSAYTYHAVKLILPLWTIAFLIYHRPLITELWKNERKTLYVTAGIFTALVLPSVVMAITPEGQARGKVVMVWIHHKGLNMFPAVLRQYLGYFEPMMLFMRGGPHLSQSMPGVGIWNLIDLPLMILGFVAMAKGGHRAYGMIFFWFLLGPLPGAMTYETGNIGRSIAWLPAPQLIAGLGFASLLEYRGHKAVRAVFAAALAAGFIATGIVHFKTTLEVYPRRAEREFQYEITHSLRCARELRTNGEKIIVSPGLIGNEVAETFVGFYFGDLFEAKSRGQNWDLAQRTVVAPGELYLMKNGPAPKGKKLCEVKLRDGAVVAQVFGAE